MLRFVVLPLAIGVLAASLHSYASTIGFISPGAPRSDGSVAAAAQRQLVVRPLEGASLYALALSAEHSGDQDNTARLVEQAIRINPRLRTARTWDLAHAVRTGNADRAINQALVLARLSPAAARPVGVILAQLAQDPASRRTLAKRLANDPLILAVLSEAAQSGAPPAALFELIAPTDLSQLPDGVARAQAAIVGPMVRAAKFGEARRTWLAIAGLPDQTLVFDGEFKGQVGSPPFGWTLHTSANLETAIAPADSVGGGLKTTAYGSLAVTAAEQSLTLSPGPYTLAFTGRAEDDVEGSGFAWTLSCNSGGTIAVIPVQVSANRTGQRARIVVPASCPMQVLRLVKLRTPDTAARTLELECVLITRD